MSLALSIVMTFSFFSLLHLFLSSAEEEADVEETDEEQETDEWGRD